MEKITLKITVIENLLLRAKIVETACIINVSSEMNVMVIDSTINQTCFERESEFKHGLFYVL